MKIKLILVFLSNSFLFLIFFHSNLTLLAQDRIHNISIVNIEDRDCSIKCISYDTAYNYSDSVFSVDTKLEFKQKKIEFPLVFYKAEFESVANFSNTIFEKETIFIKTKFENNSDCFSAAFYNGIFRKKSYFERSKFRGKVYFDAAKFEEDAIFCNAKFYNKVSFDRCMIIGKSNFSNVFFGNTALFTNINFGDTSSFLNVTFSDSVDFNGSVFSYKVDFSNAIMPENLFLCNVQSSLPLDLTNVKFSDQNTVCNIYLTETDISKVNFRYERFHLSFREIDTLNDVKCQVYQQLLEKFKREGYESSYKKLNIEYFKFRYRELEQYYIFGYFINLLQKYWWGYGYEKWRLLYCIPLLFLTLTIVSNWYVKYLNPLIDNNLEKSFQNIKSSIIIVATLFFGLEFNLKSLKEIGNSKPIPLKATIFFLITYLFGLVSMGFLLNAFVTSGPTIFK